MKGLWKTKQWFTVLLPTLIIDICVYLTFDFFQLHWTGILKTNTEPFQQTGDYPHMLFIPAIIFLFIGIVVVWFLEREAAYTKFLTLKLVVFLIFSYLVWYFKFIGNQSPFIPVSMEKYWRYFLCQWLLIGIDLALVAFILWRNKSKIFTKSK